MNHLDLINPLTGEREAECDAHIARERKRIQATWTEDERHCRSYIRITSPCTARIITKNTCHYLEVRNGGDGTASHYIELPRMIKIEWTDETGITRSYERL